MGGWIRRSALQKSAGVSGDGIRLVAGVILRTMRGGGTTRSKRNFLIPVKISTERVRLARRRIRVLFKRNCRLAGFGRLVNKRFTSGRGIAVINLGLETVRGMEILKPIEGGARMRVSTASTVDLKMGTPVERSKGVTKDTPVTVVKPGNTICLGRKYVITGERVRVTPGSTVTTKIRSNSVMSMGTSGREKAVFGGMRVHMSSDFALRVRVSASRTGTTRVGDKSAIEVMSYW